MGLASQCLSQTSNAAKISTQKEYAAVRRGAYGQALSTLFVKEQRAGRARDGTSRSILIPGRALTMCTPARESPSSL